MAKSTCLIALFVAVVVCADAIRIDTVQPERSRRGKYFPSIQKNDPRCNKKVNETIADPKDCTKYIKCVKGDSQVKKCPQGFKFDSKKHCVLPSENPDCGKKKHSEPLDEEECPRNFGYFPVVSDCHKYKICSDGKANVKTCPEKHVYSDTIGSCIEGNKCPSKSEEESVCQKPNESLPYEGDCRKYIKCKNYNPVVRDCPSGTAFDLRVRRCTKEQLEMCRNNDIRKVVQD